VNILWHKNRGKTVKSPVARASAHVCFLSKRRTLTYTAVLRKVVPQKQGAYMQGPFSALHKSEQKRTRQCGKVLWVMVIFNSCLIEAQGFLA